jgi:hypothetical protein
MEQKGHLAMKQKPCSKKGLHHAAERVFTMQQKGSSPCSRKGLHHAAERVFTMQQKSL